MAEPLPLDVDAIASETFALLRSGRQTAPFSGRYAGFDLAAAYRVAARVHALRASEKPAGRKIGFTNRRIWPEYGVWAPIWGWVYESTVHRLGEVADGFALEGLAEPRIEPEIMFGFGAPPQPGMDDDELLRCVRWVSHGFEIVQSIFPGWRFAAADTAAAYGLHGALLVGERVEIGADVARWRDALRSFEIELRCDGASVDRGSASHVLDGPVSAIRHLVDVLAGQPEQPPLAAGEIVTTGTLTRAFPVEPGQTWSTVLAGIELPGVRVRFR